MNSWTSATILVHEVKLLSEHADEEKHFQCEICDLAHNCCCIFFICAYSPPLRFCFLTPAKECKHYRDTFCLSKSQKTHKGSTTSCIIEQVVYKKYNHISKGNQSRRCRRMVMLAENKSFKQGISMCSLGWALKAGQERWQWVDSEGRRTMVGQSSFTCVRKIYSRVLKSLLAQISLASQQEITLLLQLSLL